MINNVLQLIFLINMTSNSIIFLASKKITGIPVIINTSMNVMGEPIVNTPQQAYQMIVKTDMDYIVMGNCLVSKKK